MLTTFSFLAFFSTAFMWELMGWRVLLQLAGIGIIAIVGEILVSSQGYYHYTRQITNGPFIRNVPLWIPFLWIFSIQSGFLIGLVIGLSGVAACIFSGIFAVIFDLILLEPYFSRRKGFWIWTSVENGYFSFIPKRIDRFTAPPGNYIVWWIFPIMLNYAVVILSFLIP